MKKHLQFYTDVLYDYINNYNIIKATNTVYKQKVYKKTGPEDNAENVEELDVEEQKVQQLDVEEQKVEEQKVEELDVEEQKVEEQKVEEQKVEEQKVEKVEEPEVEDSEKVADPKKTKKHKRCPNGERRNKVTKKCEQYKK